MHLCLQNATTWRTRPRLPSKACKLTVRSRGQSLQCCGPSRLCSACHGYPASTPSQGIKMHEGSTNPRLKQELCSATGLALRATEVTAQSLGKAMSTLVVQERHRWLSLAERSDIDKARFLDALVSQAGLFDDTVEDCVQQFSAVQKQTKAIQHILPRREAPSATTPPQGKPQSARRRGRPPVSSRAAPPRGELSPRPAFRASRRSAAPPRVPSGPDIFQGGDKAALTRATRRCGKLLDLRRWRGQCRSFPRRRAGGESFILFRRWLKGHIVKERAISLSSEFSGSRADSV